MNELILILSNYSITDAIKAEENDRQFLAIKKLIEGVSNKEMIFPLVIANSLIGYQLSGTGEEYWEEFAIAVLNYDFGIGFDFTRLMHFFEEFLPSSKCNKRLLNMKIPRLLKTREIFEDLHNNGVKYYYDNLLFLQEAISKSMKQNKDNKTVLFAIKMFHYAARSHFGQFILAPYEIGIPLDSRIAKIERKYNKDNIPSQLFWQNISKEINIPCMHLDAILWTKCNDFTCF